MRFLDLFAGIGGFRLGMEMAGHEPVGYVEWDKFARRSYEAMYDTKGEWTAHDITEVTDEQWRELRGSVDVITGGFPCQAFSVAGKRGGFSDTRGTMFFEIARAAEQIKPRILFLENVKGLLSSKTPVTFHDIIELINHEIVGGTLWVEKFTPINNWNMLSDNISHYLSDKLQMNLIFQNLKLGTSSMKNLGLVYEKSAEKVGLGLRKRLKYLEIQISQTMKKQNNYQTELMRQLEGKGEDWGSILKRLFSIENLNMVDISMLEKAMVINGETESLLRKRLEENSNQMKSSTTSMESKQTTDQRICTFVQELNTLLFIIKQWRLSTNLWKRIMSNLMKKKEGMYYVGTFNIIINTLSEIGYDCEYQVLNSKNFGVPQNRERTFIVGHLRGTGGREVFPIRAENKGTNWRGLNRNQKQNAVICPVITPDRLKKRQNGRRFKENEEPSFTLTSQDRHGVAVLRPVRTEYGKEIRKAYENGEVKESRHNMTKLEPRQDRISNTITTVQKDNLLKEDFKIRKLTPKECWRLQGFPDELFNKAQEVNSDSQLYKQAGNAVTVNVIYEIAKRLE